MLWDGVVELERHGRGGAVCKERYSLQHLVADGLGEDEGLLDSHARLQRARHDPVVRSAGMVAW